MRRSLSLYVHYPYCRSKCPYCDFNSHVRKDINYSRLLKCYEREIDFFSSKTSDRRVETIFFGGGTPSLMPVWFCEGILSKIKSSWSVSDDVEITIETNPTSYEASNFSKLRQIGINRISIGVQSFNDSDLKFLGREHSSNEAALVIKSASEIFSNFSFDLIYARPSQTLKAWEEELEYAMSFSPNHISLYQLTIEKGTKFFSQFRKGEFSLPDDDTSASLYEITSSILSKYNIRSYEVSNYSKPGFECKHNLNYWEGADYLGIGPGAHSRAYLESDIRKRASVVMLSDPDSWAKRVEEEGSGIQSISYLTLDEIVEEIIMTGLRTQKGVSNSALSYHVSKTFEELVDVQKLQKLASLGFIELSKNSERPIKALKPIVLNQIISKVCDAIRSNS